MPLTPAQIDILNKLDAPNVRQRLQYAGAGSGSIERFPLNLNREDYRGSLGRANQIRFLR